MARPPGISTLIRELPSGRERKDIFCWLPGMFMACPQARARRLRYLLAWHARHGLMFRIGSDQAFPIRAASIRLEALCALCLNSGAHSESIRPARARHVLSCAVSWWVARSVCGVDNEEIGNGSPGCAIRLPWEWAARRASGSYNRCWRADFYAGVCDGLAQRHHPVCGAGVLTVPRLT